MDDAILRRLRALPPLDPANARGQAVPCKVCGAAAPPFDVVDLNKFCSETQPYLFGLAGVPVVYHRCGCCGLLFTPFFDNWAPAAFAAFIYNADYVKVDGAYVEERPAAFAALVARHGAARGARVLDYGSGAGVFAARLSAHGFADVTSYDPFSNPARPEGRFDVITCFEVIEHSVAPALIMRDIAGMLRDGGCVLMSTGIQPEDIAHRRGSWWYVGPRNGHATIFSLDALAMLGARAGLELHVGGDLLAFVRPEPSELSRAILSGGEHPYAFALLAAAEPGGAAGWHEPEGAGADAFRWTASSRIDWSVTLPSGGSCFLRVAIPMRMEIAAGFMDGAELLVNGQALPVVRAAPPAMLVAEGVVPHGGPATLTLATRAPLRPVDLGASPDSRPLGVAVATEAAVRAGFP